MSTLSRFILLGCGLAVSAVAAAGQVSGASAAEIKRITDRYALTRTRISALLDLRQNPVPLPANPPNPFYQPPKEAAAAPEPVEVVVPQAADISDIDTLRKYATGLRVGGVINRGGTLHLIVNNTASKVGDIITVGPKDHPIYLKMTALSTTEFTLGLNEATLSIPLKR